MFTVLTAAAIAWFVGSTVFLTDADTCGQGWGQWSVPINTLLLVVLAMVNWITRKRVEEKVSAVKEVTDTVALRKTDDAGNRDVRITREEEA